MQGAEETKPVDAFDLDSEQDDDGTKNKRGAPSTLTDLLRDNEALRQKVTSYKMQLKFRDEQLKLLTEQLALERAKRERDALAREQEKLSWTNATRKLNRELKRERFERSVAMARVNSNPHHQHQNNPSSLSAAQSLDRRRRRGLQGAAAAQGRMTAMNSNANEGPSFYVVQNAGTAEVNGAFYQDGYFDGACKYTKQGKWNGENVTFGIFQCTVSNQTRHWYISIVPSGANEAPGTSADTDFYTSPVTPEFTKVPPTSGWEMSQEGLAPPPSVSATGMHPW